MDLERIYQALCACLDRVDFAALWPGFAPLRFAVYDQERCFFDGAYVEKTADFCANTAIEYNGELIAIWQVEEESDVEVLASKMIHEMFHAFQIKSGESRFPNEMEALKRYRYSEQNLSMKLVENQWIAALTDSFDAQSFQRLFALRSARKERFPYEYAYESAVEQIEGAANYVELAALEQLSPEKHRAELNRLKKILCTPENLIPVRILSYSVGALLFRLLHMQGSAQVTAFTEIPVTTAMLDGAPNLPVSMPKESLVVRRLIDEYAQETERIIRLALDKGTIVFNGVCELLSVNIYDARYRAPYLISTYFVMLDKEGQTDVLYGDFVIELAETEKVKTIYQIA